MLEVLDPEQNNTFRDHFLDVPFDLSKVFFITTGNLADPIHPALKDRMEIVEFPGYTKEEKLMIAKIYQIPRQLKAAGLTTDELRFSDKGIAHIIRYYTREAGVRNLEREIANICRKKAKKITEAEEAGKTGISKKEIITPKKVSKYLGPIRLPSLLEGRITGPGIATGLAWTEAGGEVTFIEAARVDAKNVYTELTGSLGKVMQESAKTAITYVQSYLKKLGTEKAQLPVESKIHIHVPQGAVEKEGPSAGITIATALISLVLGRKMRKDVAMTGELTLSGTILPVGGMKEKVLAAKEAGIKEVILPKENEKNLADFPDSLKRAIEKGEIKLTFVEMAEQVFEIALEK